MDTLRSGISLVALLAGVTLVAGCLYIKALPALAIIIGNIPEIILADFQLRGNTCGTVSAVRSGGFHAGVGLVDPPVAVLADVRALTVSAVCTGSFHAGVGLANPPVSVLADVRALTVSAV